MKKLILIISVFFLLNQPSIKDIPNKELPMLIQAGQEEGWELNEWQVVAIGEYTKDEFDNISNNLQNGYFVTTSKENNTVKYTFESNNKDSTINHSFYAVIHGLNEDRVTLQTVISGNKWNDDISRDYAVLTKSLQSHYNIMFTRNFTCLKFKVSGIINNGFFFDEFWQKMKVVHKKEQYDNVQHSVYEKEIYGYSPLWGNVIDVNNEKINLQMSIKNDEENKKQVIVGTPMIINEY